MLKELLSIDIILLQQTYFGLTILSEYNRFPVYDSLCVCNQFDPNHTLIIHINHV